MVRPWSLVKGHVDWAFHFITVFFVLGFYVFQDTFKLFLVDWVYVPWLLLLEFRPLLLLLLVIIVHLLLRCLDLLLQLHPLLEVWLDKVVFFINCFDLSVVLFKFWHFLVFISWIISPQCCCSNFSLLI